MACENCEQKGQLPLTKADIDSLSDNIHSLNTQIQQELSDIGNDIEQLKQNSCEAKIEQLQNEIEDLKSSVGALKQNSQPKPQFNQQSESYMGDKLNVLEKLSVKTLTLIVCNRLQLETPIRPNYPKSCQ